MRPPQGTVWTARGLRVGYTLGCLTVAIITISAALFGGAS